MAKIDFKPVDPRLNLPKRAGQCRCPQCQNDVELDDQLCMLHKRMVDEACDEANQLEDAWLTTDRTSK